MRSSSVSCGGQGSGSGAWHLPPSWQGSCSSSPQSGSSSWVMVFGGPGEGSGALARVTSSCLPDTLSWEGTFPLLSGETASCQGSCSSLPS